MDNTEQILQTFLIVPEVYQKIFTDNGIDFPDEMVQQIQEDPESALQLVAENEDLQKAIVSAFNSNQDGVLQAIQQKQSAQQFRFGGVLKAQEGMKVFNARTPNQAKRYVIIRGKKVPNLPNVDRRRIGLAVDPSGTQYVGEWGDIGPKGAGTTASTIVSVPSPGDTLVNQRIFTGRDDDAVRNYDQYD